MVRGEVSTARRSSRAVKSDSSSKNCGQMEAMCLQLELDGRDSGLKEGVFDGVDAAIGKFWNGQTKHDANK
jgi:hypothetical protein